MYLEDTVVMTEKYTKGFYPHTISGSNTKRKTKISTDLKEMIDASATYKELLKRSVKKKMRVGNPQ